MTTFNELETYIMCKIEEYKLSPVTGAIYHHVFTENFDSKGERGVDFPHLMKRLHLSVDEVWTCLFELKIAGLITNCATRGFSTKVHVLINGQKLEFGVNHG